MTSDVAQSNVVANAQTEWRSKEESAQQVFEGLYRNPQLRRRCALALAEAIDCAHAVAPGAWGVTLKKDLLRLNVGGEGAAKPQRRTRLRAKVDG